MEISAPRSFSSALRISIAATTLAAIILASNFVVSNAQLPTQQEVEPNEGLRATLNGDSFTKGDIITVSGTEQDGEPGSFVGIEVIDPQNEIVERGVAPITADSTFNYSFIAGEQREVDIDEPMITSGVYRMVLTYFPPSDPLRMERADLVFEYNAIGDAEDIEGADGVASNVIQPEAIQGTTFFQSIDDGFKLKVPYGWIIEDVDNTGTLLSEERARGYGLLAQLCPQEGQRRQQQEPIDPDARGDTSSCQMSENHVIHIVRYQNLDSTIQLDNNTAVISNGLTNDNALSYHLQKLQEVGYRDIEIINNADMTVNLTMSQANQTIATMPAKFVEITYTTASAPDEIRTGYLISTATNSTEPNVGMTKGYTVFYEGNPVSAAELTIGFGSLSLMPPPVKQVFDSFELIAAPEVQQAITQQAAEAAEAVEGDDGESEDEGDDGESEDEGDDGESEDEGDDGESEDEGDDGESEDEGD
jgi:hypothetical protein